MEMDSVDSEVFHLIEFPCYVDLRFSRLGQ